MSGDCSSNDNSLTGFGLQANVYSKLSETQVGKSHLVQEISYKSPQRKARRFPTYKLTLKKPGYKKGCSSSSAEPLTGLSPVEKSYVELSESGLSRISELSARLPETGEYTALRSPIESPASSAVSQDTSSSFSHFSLSKYDKEFQKWGLSYLSSLEEHKSLARLNSPKRKAFGRSDIWSSQTPPKTLAHSTGCSSSSAESLTALSPVEQPYVELSESGLSRTSELSATFPETRKYAALSSPLESPATSAVSQGSSSSVSHFSLSKYDNECQKQCLPLLSSHIEQTSLTMFDSPQRRSIRGSGTWSSQTPPKTLAHSTDNSSLSDNSLDRLILEASLYSSEKLQETPLTDISAVHRPVSITTNDEGGSTSSVDSFTRVLLQVPTYQPAETSSISPVSAKGGSTSSVDSFTRVLLQVPTYQPAETSSTSPVSAQGQNTQQEELKTEKELPDRIRRGESSCSCNISKHPSWWSLQTIIDVHNNSFLLDCKGLVLTRNRVVGLNSESTVVVYNVPMEYGHPWKVKAEQVLRFVNVEMGTNGQAAYDTQYYMQPHHRKVFVVVTSERVVGIVVAEKKLSARRIAMETVRLRGLEADPVPVRVGINRLWVHVSMRRQHIATYLCQIVGELFYEGERLRKDDYAFNYISDAAVAFARLFLKTSKVPIYNGRTGRKI